MCVHLCERERASERAREREIVSEREREREGEIERERERERDRAREKKEKPRERKRERASGLAHLDSGKHKQALILSQPPKPNPQTTIVIRATSVIASGLAQLDSGNYKQELLSQPLAVARVAVLVYWYPRQLFCKSSSNPKSEARNTKQPVLKLWVMRVGCYRVRRETLDEF